MGIEACHHEVGVGAEPFAEGEQGVQLALDQGAIQLLRHRRQGNVRGGQEGIQAPLA